MAGKATAGLAESNGSLLHVCHCGPGGRWWQPITGFMDMHAVTCRLTDEYGIISVPEHSTYEYGTVPILNSDCTSIQWQWLVLMISAYR